MEPPRRRGTGREAGGRTMTCMPEPGGLSPDSTTPQEGPPGRSGGHQVYPGTTFAIQHVDSISVYNITTTATPARPPRQVRRRTTKFINREAELDQLDALLDDAAEFGGPAVGVLTGYVGVGKSAVAAEWATLRSEAFSDGQLHVALRELRHGGGVAVADVLGDFLRALGATSVPESLSARVMLYRSVTATKRLLVVVDDAVHSAEVTPLIPNSSDAVVLVTAAGDLGELFVDGAQNVGVRLLDSASVKGFFQRVLGADRLRGEDDAIEALATMSSGLPLALAIATGMLARRQDMSVSSLVERLQDDRRRLDTLVVEGDRSLRSIFDAALGEVSGTAAACYVHLGLHVGPVFSAEAAAAASGMPPADARAALEELVDRGLLQYASADRYGFHDLLWAHAVHVAHETLVDSVRDEVQRAVVEWYLAAVQSADIAIIPERLRLSPRLMRESTPRFEDAAQAFAWLTAERANVVSAVRHAVSLGLATLPWRFCEALWLYYLNHRVYVDWQETHQLAIDAAVATGEELAEARVRQQLAWALMEHQEYAAAAAELERARSLAENRSEDLHASIVEFTGKLEYERGRPAEALRWLRQSRAVYQRLGRERGVALQELHIGRAYMHMGQPRRALAYLRAALRGVDGMRDPLTRGHVLSDLGRAWLAVGRFDDAERDLLEAVTLTARLGSPFDQAVASIALGDVLKEKGNVEEARLWWHEVGRLLPDPESRPAREAAQRLRHV